MRLRSEGLQMFIFGGAFHKLRSLLYLELLRTENLLKYRINLMKFSKGKCRVL